MIVTINQEPEVRTKNDREYLYAHYIGANGREGGKAIFKELQEKWGLIKNGARLNFVLTTDGKYNVVDIQPVKPEDEPPPEPKPSGQSEPNVKTQYAEGIPPRGEEIGRAWNGIDNLYVGGKLATLFGKENAEAILKYYRGVLTATLKLPVDGAKLPMWDKKESQS